jgi:hypothetical protein
MKKLLIYISSACLALTVPASSAFAGNEDRAGQSGANELLINPWARNSGWGAAGLAMIRGIESSSLNPAGLAYTKGTDIVFSNTTWLKGADIKINAFGISQKVGESGALGLAINSVGFGDIKRTTEALPDGGAGQFTPQFFTIGLSYAKSFSNSIKGGMTAKIISEAINDVKAQGFVLDAGIEYTSGFNKEKDNLRFAIALRNVGTPMKFEGEGLLYRNDNQAANINVLQSQQAQTFEMPSLVTIGVAYDIKLMADHRLSPAFTFISNSFIRDQFGVGVEYGFKDMFMVRGAYSFDRKDKTAIQDEEISALNGLSGGVSFELPLGKSGKRFGIDYSYRATDTFDGTHSFGARLVL